MTMSKSESFLHDIHDYLMKSDNNKLIRMLSKSLADEEEFSDKSPFEIELLVKESFEENLRYNDELERSYLVEHVLNAIDKNNERVRPDQPIFLNKDGSFVVDLIDIQNDFLKDYVMNFDFLITKTSPAVIREHYSNIDIVKEKSKLKSLTLSDDSKIEIGNNGMQIVNKDGIRSELDAEHLDRFKSIISKATAIQKTRENASLSHGI